MSVRGGRTFTVYASGVSGIRKALAPWLEPELTQELDAANRAAARTLAKALRAEVKPLSRRMAKAVRVKRARTGKPGWVVGSRRKVAFFWHFVIGGTKAHGPKKADALVFRVNGKLVRTKRVRGVRGVPVIERVMQRYERRVADEIDNQLVRGSGL